MKLLFVFATCAYIFFSITNLKALVNEPFDVPLEKKIIDDATTTSTSKPAIVQEYETKICANKPTCHLVHQMPQNDQTFPNRDCMCDADCVTYGDCCLDSKFYNRTEQSLNYLSFYCSKPKLIYIKNKCPANFSDVEIVEKCQIANATFRSADTDLVAFVTDLKTRITYANKYCARCDNIDDYVVWNVTYDCYFSTLFDVLAIPDEESKQNLHQKVPQLVKLNATDNNFYAELNGTKYECSQSIIKPSKLRTVNFRKCLTTSFSCPTTYSSDNETIPKCQSYTSIVYDLNTPKLYRNKDCAKCNGIPEANVTGCKPKQHIRPHVAFSEVFVTYDKAQGSDTCGSDVDSAVKDKFCR